MFGATKGSDTTGYGGLVAPILFPGAAERPYGGYFDAVADELGKALSRGDSAGDTSYEKAVEKVSSTAAR
jgi:NADH-quinone oxidoreductase subunit C